MERAKKLQMKAGGADGEVETVGGSAERDGMAGKWGAARRGIGDGQLRGW